MTAYQGGKKQIGQELAEIINEVIEEEKFSCYLEPMMGMGSVMKHIVCSKRSGCDLNADVVQMWKEFLAEKWEPSGKHVSKSEYEYWRNDVEGPDANRGFIGSACSFGGQFFMGYGKSHNHRNLAKAGANSLMRVKPLMKGVRMLRSGPF